MKQWIEDLLDLQEIDMRRKRLEMRLTMLPKEMARLNEELEEARVSSHDTKEKVAKTEMDIKKVESEIEKENQVITKLQSQSLMIKKNDEYKAMLSEIEHHKRIISDYETKEIGLLDVLEDSTNDLSEAGKMFAMKEKAIKEQLQELKEVEEDVKAEIEKLKPVRQERASRIEGVILSIYERLEKRNRGIPFVPVEHDNCGNCHLRLTPQTINETRKEIVVFCDNCNHLLYMPDH